MGRTTAAWAGGGSLVPQTGECPPPSLLGVAPRCLRCGEDDPEQFKNYSPSRCLACRGDDQRRYRQRTQAAWVQLVPDGLPACRGCTLRYHALDGGLCPMCIAERAKAA